MRFFSASVFVFRSTSFIFAFFYMAFWIREMRLTDLSTQTNKTSKNKMFAAFFFLALASHTLFGAPFAVFVWPFVETLLFNIHLIREEEEMK